VIINLNISTETKRRKNRPNQTSCKH